MADTLTQTQIIQSLGEALSWFERELSWGVSPAELNHLTGRIGELYAAMMTRGQMALSSKQRGYDVVSDRGERISVKTVTSAVHVVFNPATLTEADRIMILRLRVDEDRGVTIEELLDKSALEMKGLLRPSGNKLRYPIPGYRTVSPDTPTALRVSETAAYAGIELRRFENGHISLMRAGKAIVPVAPELRNLAAGLGIDL